MVNNNIIKASPTKDFFIDMLTRDIPLGRAIIDLIDNSIDGAKNLHNDENYKGLYVELTLRSDKFIIKDNCGGFPLKVAKEYAFRFGRPKEAKFVDHSIGRFGVGMKRALFKIGKYFTVESKHKNDHFLIEVDVDKWLNLPEEQWDFRYTNGSDIPIEKRNLDSDGTLVTVTSLHKNVSFDFSSNSFLNDLEKEIGLSLNFSFLKKLEVKVNGKKINSKDISFLWSNSLKPYYKNLKVQNDVQVEIYCGIGEPMPNIAGWYIYCNDRLVLEADKSYTTGWKEEKEDESSIIKYHNKYAMFRGVVLFDSKDSSKLPMTTTKTGIDSDHPIFKSTRPEMLIGMKQVLIFLNKINDKEIRDNLVVNATNKNVEEIRKLTSEMTSKFEAPALNIPKENMGFSSISYSKERQMIEKVKDHIGASTNREVGEKTFDFYVNMNKRDF